MFYFDHNSTTPLDPRVADLLDNANRSVFGNASSSHRIGQRARQMLEQSRRNIAASLGAKDTEIVFTSGGTEANNLALSGVLQPGAHAVTSVVEHPSVLEPFRQLEREGVAVSYVPVDKRGVVAMDAVAGCIRPETRLVSIMLANNETGAIQPLAKIANLLRGRNILLHSDGVQAVGKMPVHLGELGVDLFSISGHKLYAPKGIGVLFVRKGTKLKSMHLGGRHERGMRAGTENVPLAMALDCALGLTNEAEQQRIASLRDYFEMRIQAEIPDVQINSADAARIPNTSNVAFAGTSGEALLIAMDTKGISVSTGSACSSGSIEPSHVLLEMRLSVRQARSSIRFSFGRENSIADVDVLVDALIEAVGKARKNLLEKQYA